MSDLEYKYMNLEAITYVNSNKRPLITILLLFIIIFISDDTLTFGTNENQIFIIGRYVIYALTSIFLFCNLNIGKHVILFKIKEILLFSLIVFSILITVLINGDFRMGYLLQFITIFLALLIVKKIDLSELLHYFSKYLFILSIASLFVFVIASIFPGIISLFPTTTNFGGVEFNNLLICAVFKDIAFLRNTSIFREPGVFTIYLLFGLVIELFCKPKISKKYLFVFITALVTTFSTSGILILMLLAIGYMLKENNYKVYLIVSISIVLVGIVLLFLPELFNQFFSKLNSDSSDYISTLSRLSSFSVPLLIFFHNPLYGSGLSNFVTLYGAYSVELFGIFIDPESSSTNTIVNTFAIFGIIFGSLIIYSLIRFSRLIIKMRIPSAFILISIATMISTQELRYSLFFNVVFMYGLMSENLTK